MYARCTIAKSSTQATSNLLRNEPNSALRLVRNPAIRLQPARPKASSVVARLRMELHPHAERNRLDRDGVLELLE